MITNPIPQELILRAVNNLDATLRHMPEGQHMNEVVNAEIRRLMKQEHPSVKFTGKDITRALVQATYGNAERKPVAPQSSLLQRAYNPKGMTRDELEQRAAQVSGFVKLMAGVANNAALTIMRDCLDRIADVRSQDSYRGKPRHPHPNYRFKVKGLYNQALKERDHYRHELLYGSSQGIRFFNISDMPQDTRRKYGVVTNQDYFEFWEDTGSLAYQKSQPLIGSLWNKLRLSLQKHQVPEAELVAWALVGANVLELAVIVWDRAMHSAYEAFEGVLSMDFVRRLYQPFSLSRVSKAWQQATNALSPEMRCYDHLDPADERNIQFGIEQLSELWVSADIPFDSTIAAVEDYQDDLFATRGFAKKAIRELSELRNDAIRDLEQQGIDGTRHV